MSYKQRIFQEQREEALADRHKVEQITDAVKYLNKNKDRMTDEELKLLRWIKSEKRHWFCLGNGKRDKFFELKHRLFTEEYEKECEKERKLKREQEERKERAEYERLKAKFG